MKAVRFVFTQQGISLAEVLVALFIVSIVAVAVTAGVGTSIKSNDMARMRISAESLARSELEYVSTQAYQANSWTYTLPGGPYPTWWAATHESLPAGYTGYSITVSASDNVASPGDKSRKQKVTAVVTYSGSQVLSMATYQSQ
jgi:prepilin-type N-terminal cleavage/methylation domain-containing protein